ncbi:MAG: sppA [Chitinophagaceae bacterium]|nr:sppA [Chitinophagaceae bacterium]
MRSFFKIFFASFLALFVFCFLGVIITIWIIGAAAQPDKPSIGKNAVIVVDLSTHYAEQAEENPLSSFSGREENPGLYEVVRMINHAKTNADVKGIYIRASENMNGFAASEEIRQALKDFKNSGKFIVAYGETVSQSAYYVASIADKVYCHPQGGVEWQGFAVDMLFFKNLLDKLEIKPQIFYAGKFKSATEPLRETQMTAANREQMTALLADMRTQLLLHTASSRHIDTATLSMLAQKGAVRTAGDALSNRLVDGLKYDDEVKTEIQRWVKESSLNKINFLSLSKYAKSADFKPAGQGRIALIFAEGEIVGGKGEKGQIGGDQFVKLIRTARLDNSVKAIVFRVNSPGGSSIASDDIWREVVLARKAKPFIVSMGDYAASGGYYISCAADSIFADPGTLTGSIGVFGIIPDMHSFFANKLGITADGVKTDPYADMGTITRSLTDVEKQFIQSSIDSIYNTFKSRVAQGRKKQVAYVDSIGQGRVWSGTQAVQLGLVDRTGNLDDAINAAAKMAKLKTYKLKEYPEKRGLFDQVFGTSSDKSVASAQIKKEIGEQPYNLLQQMKKVQALFGTPQARLPFSLQFR